MGRSQAEKLCVPDVSPRKIGVSDKSIILLACQTTLI